VHALTVFDDGNGPALYAGGEFTTANGIPVHSFQMEWLELVPSVSGVSGFSAIVYALAVFDDGVGMRCTPAASSRAPVVVSANHIAKWNGSSWSSLGSSRYGGMYSLAAFNDGSGAPCSWAASSPTRVVFRQAHREVERLELVGHRRRIERQRRSLSVFNDGGGSACMQAATTTRRDSRCSTSAGGTVRVGLRLQVA